MKENYYYGLGDNPTFEDVFKRLEDFHNERYDLQAEMDRAEDLGYEPSEEKEEEVAEVESIIFDLSHKVMTNAMFVLSNGTEREFRYPLPQEFRDYHFVGELNKAKSVIYYGIEGTIDIEFCDGTECSDYDEEHWCYDDMYGLAKYLHTQFLNVA